MKTKIRFPKFNLFVIIYFSICLLVLLFDFYNTSKYYSPKLANLLDIDPSLAIVLLPSIVLISLLLCLVIFLFFSRKSLNQIKDFIYTPKFNKGDWLIMMVILFFTMLRLPIPDVSFDTLNYHLYLQSPELTNNISYNFIPSGIQTFSFPLSDHVFNIFRVLLGYRGGVLLNTLILIVIYLQVKDILLLNKIINDFFQNHSYFLTIAAFSVISTEFILANIGIYMVDLLAIPFLLEILKWTTAEKHDPKFVLPYIVLLAGFAVSLKFFVVIFCLPLVLFEIFRYFKNLTIKLLLTIIFLFVFPLIPYLVYNFTQTNNPIFPYFNNLFNSPFFLLGYWKDERWGPKNILETLLWPIYIFFSPNRTSELSYYSGRLSLGYLVSIFYFYQGMRIRNKRMVLWSFIFFISTILWVTNTGYVRYGSYLEIYSGLIILESLILLANSDSKIRIASSGIVLSLLLIQVMNGYFYTMSNKTDWSVRQTLFGNPQFYLENIKYIFNDYQLLSTTNDYEEKLNLIDTVDYWVVTPWENNSGIVNSVKKNIPIINLGYIDTTESTREIFSDIYKNNKLYTKNKFLITTKSVDDLSTKLENIGYKISEIYNINLTVYEMRQNALLIKIIEK